MTKQALLNVLDQYCHTSWIRDSVTKHVFSEEELDLIHKMVITSCDMKEEYKRRHHRAS